jgi:phosphoenolpyruvate synthase/pyruvate phosphate dikinase
MEVAAGILTSRGGMTSHAAVVTRGMGKCCVAGAGDCVVDEAKKELRVKGHTFKQGDWISLDGTTGRVIAGKLKTLDAQPDDPDLVKFMSWVDPVRRLAFAPTPTSLATPRRLACSAPKASASAAPSTCSLPKTASNTCAP